MGRDECTSGSWREWSQHKSERTGIGGGIASALAEILENDVLNAKIGGVKGEDQWISICVLCWAVGVSRAVENRRLQPQL